MSLFGRSFWYVFAYMLLLVGPARMAVEKASGPSASDVALGQTGSSQPPPPPTGLAGAATSITSISWTWNPSPTATSYTLINADTAQPVPGATDIPGTSFLESGLTENSPESRYVVAKNAFGTSGPSNTVRRYTLVGGHPFTVVRDAGTITVDIEPPPNGTSDQTGVEIQREELSKSHKDPSTVTIVQSFSNAYTFVDGDIKNNITYCYAIRFRNGDGILASTSFSEPVCDIAPGPPLCHITNGRVTLRNPAPNMGNNFVDPDGVITFPPAGAVGTTYPVSMGGTLNKVTSQWPQMVIEYDVTTKFTVDTQVEVEIDVRYQNNLADAGVLFAYQDPEVDAELVLQGTSAAPTQEFGGPHVWDTSAIPPLTAPKKVDASLSIFQDVNPGLRKGKLTIALDGYQKVFGLDPAKVLNMTNVISVMKPPKCKYKPI